ncbi:MAG: sporulation protein YabP [Anaeromicrobium sp.]|jgi:sporulation protein YabP|uniref:sporulation protein YabP n=1 Tax=Anaeromicrobium sp. TaxID=1929132 RepID=UPI0025CD2789|nr:sporulation protein YabP [Anaeromicrobium sp.]MCT4594050.1 sporulation protein YabP [Anaeromicrobium sp.]
MEERRSIKGRSQNIILEDREKISISGVEHVHSFDENAVILETIKGILTIRGSELDMNKLNLEDGNVVVKGIVDSMVYTDKESLGSKGVGFLGKMFK